MDPGHPGDPRRDRTPVITTQSKGTTHMQLKNIAVIGVSAAIAAVGIGIGAGGSAYADSLLGSAGIQDDSVRSVDVKDGTLRLKDMTPGARHEDHGTTRTPCTG